jgi:hypothetical protein
MGWRVVEKANIVEARRQHNRAGAKSKRRESGLLLFHCYYSVRGHLDE